MTELTQQQRILKRAAGEIGYSRWTDPKQGTKYARETQPALWPKDKWLLANGISFCDIFITWVFWKENLLDILPAGASYNTDYRASKGGRIDKKKAAPGDVLVFDWNWKTLSTNHVGILEKVLPSGNFQTIEANTSPGNSGSQGNGGGVYRRNRRPNQVRYVIRPNWNNKTAPKPATPSKPAAKPAPAKTKLKVDGRCGTETSKDFQKFLNTKNKKRVLKVDGRLGPESYKSMQEWLNAPYVDGKISRQSYKHTELGNGISPNGWEFTGRGSKGSQTVKLLQKWAGVKNPDGIWYEGTTKKIQEKLNKE